MGFHDSNGFSFGNWRGYIALLDPINPANPVFQGLAKDDQGVRHAVLARQNWGSLEFLVRSETELHRCGQTPLVKDVLEKLNAGGSFPFIIDAAGGHLSWQHPFAKTRQIIAEKYAESALDYTGCIETCRVMGADRSKPGMISHMHL